MGTITLTDEARRYLTPRSIDALAPSKTVDRAALFAKLCEGARLFRTSGWTDEAPLEADGPAARAILAGGVEPASEPSLRTWAVALRLSLEKKSGVAYLAQRLGVVAAFEALLQASSIDYEADVRKQHTTLSLRPVQHPLLDTGIDTLLLRASEAEQHAAHALSDARFDHAPFVEQMVHVESRFDRPEWADALVEPFMKRARRDGEGWRVLIARLGSLELARPLLADAVSSSVVDLIRFGDAALPLLIDALTHASDAHHLKHLSRAIALFDDPRAADALASVATRAPAQPFALEFFQRHPREAARALAPLGEGKSKAAEKVRELLRRIPSAVDDAPKSAAPTKAKAGATPAALPDVLTSPPWSKGKKTRRAPIVIASLALPSIDAITEDPADEEKRAELAPLLAEPLSAEEKQKLSAWVDSPKPQGAVPRWVQLPRDEAIALYARWPAHRPHLIDMEREALALFGLDAMEGLLRHAARALEHELAQTWILRVSSPRLAMVLLRAASEIDQAGVIGDWLTIHRDAAIAGILPIAVGPLGDDRAIAERGLLELARLHGREAIFRAAPEARAACEEIFAHAVGLFGPLRPPKVETELAGLPAVHLRSGVPLTAEAMATLVGYLASSTLALRHPAIDAVIEACEPRDLAELAWTLARSWEIGRAKKAKTWMIDALLPLADDDVVRRVLPGLKKARALTVLGSIASDAAAVELISATESGALAHQAGRELLRIARRRAQSVDELEESLAPSFLEGDTLRLTLGGQAYVVRLDAQLALRIEDASGKVSRRLPPPSGAASEDDHDARMRARHAELVADVARLTPRRLRVLEGRMILGTTMTYDALMTRHLRHPLWASIARGLVWSWALPSGETGTFRITEEGAFEDEHEKPLALDPTQRAVARFGLPHPLRLPASVRARWATLLADYAIVQPFPQIGRAVTLPTEAERNESVLRRPAAFGADQHPPATPDRGLRGSGPRGWLYRVATKGRVLVLSGPSIAPFHVEMSLFGGPQLRTPEPLRVLDPIVIAEHFHALGA